MHFPPSPSRLTLMRTAGLGLVFSCLITTGWADSVVVFNEIQYNPAGPSEVGEWIELHNEMAVNVDLSGWRLDDGVAYTFPAGTVIEGGGFVVVARDPGNPALAGVGTVLGPFTGALSNGGEEIELLSSSDRVMDRVNYGDGGVWPVSPDGSGVTLAKRRAGLLSGESTSWVASPQVGGTPGAVNFLAVTDLIQHDLVNEEATWKYEDGGATPAGGWTTVGFGDGTWSEGVGLFGSGGETGTMTLTVTDHLTERFRAADIPGGTQGQVLTTWEDTATDDGVVQTATAGSNPTFQAAVTPSGQPAVRFDGNDEFRTAAVPGIGATSGFVYFAVVRANRAPDNGSVTGGDGDYLWDRESAVDEPLVSLKAVGGRFGFQKRLNNSGELGGPVSNTSISTSDFQIVALRRNRTDGRFEIWVDGVMEATSSDGGGSLTPQPINIGRHATNSTGGFDGDIAELLIYNDELSAAEFNAVGAYLESFYGLDTAFPGSAVATPISDTAGTTYFRQTFNYAGDPARTSVRLSATVSDGAVVYLNGMEVERINLPAGTVSHSTDALTDESTPLSTGLVSLPTAMLNNGPNVLAVSLHTAAGDNTTTFGATLEATETPADLGATNGLVLNEVAGALDDPFFVELINVGSGPLDTTGYELMIEGDDPDVIPVPAMMLAPGGVLQMNQAQLGQRPASGDKLFVATPGGVGITDGQEVTGRLRGRSAEFPGKWIFPSVATPGAANVFFFETDIVINEICYNPHLLPRGAGNPPPRRARSEEQWVELYNRGAATVDLSDWDFDDGIGYEFPEGTFLASGDYLVVAKDPVALAAAHPGIDIVGPYSGNLSRGGERLLLRDSFNNPADELTYVDGGRWPEAPDGGGSTLELRDPDADNTKPGAWAASNELGRTFWQTYTYRMTANASAVGPDGQWNEFILGLHEGGEVLLDDIRVVEDPDGENVSMLADGTFESGNLNAWRLLGNHRHGAIVPDPDGGGNNVLYLRATGSTEHMDNHLETTLAFGGSINNGKDYEISFRARWLSGWDELNTRLYFNRVAKTTELSRPTLMGTPGAANSTAVSNLGPTANGLLHSPAVPLAGDSVRVQVELEDPDGVDEVTLHYSVASGAFQSVPMSLAGPGSTYEGFIPGQSSGVVVQFYVEATDLLGATTLEPAMGPDSRALFRVDDGAAASTGIHNIRIIMTPDDDAWMHTPINVMSNDRLGCTVIYKEEEIFYNVGVRIKGSERARRQASRVGFNVAFNEDQLFRGVHRTVAIDRSEGQVVGQREIFFDLMATSTGGVPGEFNDLCVVLAPRSVHTSAAILQMARFGSVFLDEQFEDGSDGSVFEYELIYYQRTADSDGYKIPYPAPDDVQGVSIQDLGPDKESYRWNYLLKNNQEQDDYSGIFALTQLFDANPISQSEAEQVLDVDQWLRALAYSCATGSGDSFYPNSRHNGQFYVRPDGKVLYFPHDQDFSFSTTRGITVNRELNRLIVDVAKRRAYLSHLYEICTSVYNKAWMEPWAAHFDDLVPGGSVFSDDLDYIGDRSEFILGAIDGEVGLTFSITTNGGSDFSTSASPVTLVGEGGLEVDEIRLAGSSVALPVVWTDTDRWSLAVPLDTGANVLALEAYDPSGALVGTDSITVTKTGSSTVPATDNLVVSKIYYNPPGGAEGAEYVELLNISPTVTLDLTGLSFTAGIGFTFPSNAELLPGERVLLVSNQLAFEAEFGMGLPIGGTYTGILDNGGETLTLQTPNGSVVQSFAYDDEGAWPTAADGDGFALVLIDPDSAPDHNLPSSWRASAAVGGAPGFPDLESFASWKAANGNPADDADDDGDGWTTVQEYYLGGELGVSNDLEPGFVFVQEGGTFTATVTRRANAEGGLPVLESSSDLLNWSPADAAVLISTERLAGGPPEVDLLTFTALQVPSPRYYRFRFGP